ncbi:hypothetical protein AGLY_005532 [Aphis glycines]|uniref:Uncharacterized protein n=1 Tax=Aphis glycines TaxID=307491 RepID=A0A6G0TUS3_APHGL|nr:hypothetical protein AGLY_005532 [Aphis glycines]
MSLPKPKGSRHCSNNNRSYCSCCIGGLWINKNHIGIPRATADAVLSGYCVIAELLKFVLFYKYDSQSIKKHGKYNSERSDECIDFTMIITSRNNAPISNYGGGFRCKSEYPWCIIEVPYELFLLKLKKIKNLQIFMKSVENAKICNVDFFGPIKILTDKSSPFRIRNSNTGREDVV